MKRIYTLAVALIALIVAPCLLNAQTTLYDYESATNGTTLATQNVGPNGTNITTGLSGSGGTYVVAANPNSSGINTSSKVGFYSAGTNTGAFIYGFQGYRTGTSAGTGSNVNDALATINAIPNAVIKAKVYVPAASSITAVNFYYKVNGNNNNLTGILNTTGITGSWQTIVMGPVPPNATVNEIGFYFTGLTASTSTFYIDDITVEPLVNPNAGATALGDFSAGSVHGFASNISTFANATDPTDGTNSVGKLTVSASNIYYYGALGNGVGGAATLSLINAANASVGHTLSAKVYIPAGVNCTSISMYGKVSGTNQFGTVINSPATGSWITVTSGTLVAGSSVTEVGILTTGQTAGSIIFLDDIQITSGSVVQDFESIAIGSSVGLQNSFVFNNINAVPDPTNGAKRVAAMNAPSQTVSSPTLTY